MKQRHCGIDLLRIVSMLMITCWHIIAYGGCWINTTPDTLHYKLTWALVAFTHCAVDAYVLISGYVGVESRGRLSSIAKLWAQVAFYSVGITALFALFGKAGGKEVIFSFFPVLFEQYWFFVAYFLLTILTPLLNAGIRAINKNQAILLVMGLLTGYSVIPTVLKSGFHLPTGYLEYVNTNGGYSVWWFIVLYVIGGCMRKFGLFMHLRKRTAFAIYGICGLITLAVKILGEHIESFPMPDDLLINYSSPTVVFGAIMLVAIFAKLDALPGWSCKAIGFLAPLSFGVYLIHDHPLVRQHLMTNRFFPQGAAQHSVVGYAVKMAAYVLVVYLACSLIDWLRLKLFAKLGINRRIEALLDK